MADHLVLRQLNVSRETIEKLENFGTLLEKWTKSINLIAPRSVPDLWTRHIVDSAQLYKLAPEGWASWTDMGSGGGLPALVIAILDPDSRPITLIESDQRKCSFLRTAKRELHLNVTIVAGRIGDVSVSPTDVVSARALAPLSDLLHYSSNLIKPSGMCLFPKGSKHIDEISVAKEKYDFDLTIHPSHTHPDAGVLEISRIAPREH
ncbi:16S rRNA (guanine(527)-N(7))-methyltransferase RsmG [Pseudooctadecabacter sp.]|uniref:16S rRNA (guanine(527)-N(7))-methyltransferase RsmG n=1 Tax=Pseudooctadecabacter sp. TaxID=1966338 RepID=UPI0035C7F964